MGRNASLPCTTKGRITTNLKINLKKPELPENQTAGTPTTKELKKLNQTSTRGREPLSMTVDPAGIAGAG